MKTKLFAFMLIAVLCFGLVSCASTKAAEEPQVTNNNDGTKTVKTTMGTRKRN